MEQKRPYKDQEFAKSSFWPGFKRDFSKEFRKKAVSFLVGIAFAILLFFLGVDQVMEKVKDWYLGRDTPPRTVFYSGYVYQIEAIDSDSFVQKPLAGVEVLFKGHLKPLAKTDSTGRYFIKRQEAYGPQEYTFILRKTGYQTIDHPKIPAPQTAFDTTSIDFLLPTLSS